MKLFGWNIDRLWIEVAGCVLLVGLVAGWWTDHNHKERALGAQACESKVDAVGERQVVNTTAIDAVHSEQLRRVSDAYVSQIFRINADRDELAQRLHELAAQDRVRPQPVPRVAAAARAVCPAANPSGLDDRDRREAADLDACAKNTLELIALRQAWADMAAGRAPALAP